MVAFNHYDKDGNGIVSAENLHISIKNTGKAITITECEMLISQYKPGSNTISYEEFVQLLKFE